MSTHTECDFCGQAITGGDGLAVMAAAGVYRDGQKFTRSDLHFHAGGGRWDRATCLERALSMLVGKPTERADMGMQWQLRAVGPDYLSTGDDRPVAELGVDTRTYKLLVWAGVSTIGQLAAMTAVERAGLRGIGPRTHAKVEQALARLAGVR